MNERIKLLEKQCYETVQSASGEGYIDFNKEKFAELIVKECMSVCRKTQSEYLTERMTTDDFDTKNILAEGEAAIATVRLKMKEHFGVEE